MNTETTENVQGSRPGTEALSAYERLIGQDANSLAEQAPSYESSVTNEELKAQAANVLRFCDQTLNYLSKNPGYKGMKFEQKELTLAEELKASIEDNEDLPQEEQTLCRLFATVLESHVAQQKLDTLPPRHIQTESQRRQARSLVHRQVEFNHQVRDYIYSHPNVQRPTMIGWIEKLTEEDTGFASAVVDGAACEVATLRMLEEEGYKGRARFASVAEDYRGADIVVDVADNPKESQPVLLDVKASGRALDSHLPVDVIYDQRKRTWIAAFNKVLIDTTSHFRNPAEVGQYYKTQIFSRYPTASESLVTAMA